MKPRGRVFGMGVLAAVLATSCAPNRGDGYVRALAAGERAETAGRFLEASARYEAAAEGAKLPRDRDHARYLAALMLAHGGNLREATARLDAIGNATPATPDSARAAYKAADLRLSHGDEEAGFRGLDDLMRRFPSSGVARPALHRLVRHKDETESKEASIAYLRAMTPSLGPSELGEDIAYQIALRMAELGQDQAARDAFVTISTQWPYPRGALFDDALYRASELDEKLGRYAEAIADLERMLDEREIAHLSGSYERPRFPASMMRIAVLYRDRVKDREKAREAFHRLYTDFKSSTLRDDALWREAEMWREDGDTGTACDRLGTLARDFPDSRYVPCAAVHCPRVTRPEKSKAPSSCHAYLERLRPD